MERMDWIYKIKQKKLPSLFLKAFLFLLILFILDFIMGTFLGRLYLNQKPGDLYRVNYCVDSANEDILIFGASRANHHYVPEIFTQRMHKTCYNTGTDGQTILYNYAILKSVLKRYSPKIAILDFSRNEFRVEQESYDRLSALIPFYKSHPEIRNIINLRSPFEKYKMISQLYPYNSLIFRIIMGSIKSRKKRKNIKEQNGYIPLTEKCYNQLAVDTGYGARNLDPIKIKTFKDFINDCQKCNVKLYVIISPLFVKYLHQDLSITELKKICKEKHVSVFDFTNDSSFYDSNFFTGDGTHLNDIGARIFTNRVVDSILEN